MLVKVWWAAQVTPQDGGPHSTAPRSSGHCPQVQPSRAFISYPFSEGSLHLWLLNVDAHKPHRLSSPGTTLKRHPSSRVPCGIARGLPWNCIMVQLLLLPITDVAPEPAPLLTSSMQTSESQTLFQENLIYGQGSVTWTVSLWTESSRSRVCCPGCQPLWLWESSVVISGSAF